MDSLFPVPDSERRAALEKAQARALEMFDAIEQAGLVRAGISERQVEDAIKQLAAEQFGVTHHWHRRIVRSGPNSITTASDHPPVRTIEDGDIVYLDLGPVFEGWEADIGKSYALPGGDPAKAALVAELPRQFALMQARFREEKQITGAALYDVVVASARDAGWVFGGKIAGHIVSEFSHSQIPGPKDVTRIGPSNPEPMRNPDGNGNPRHWIGEIHLLAPDGSFGGFYEKLL